MNDSHYKEQFPSKGFFTFKIFGVSHKKAISRQNINFATADCEIGGNFEL